MSKKLEDSASRAKAVPGTREATKPQAVRSPGGSQSASGVVGPSPSPSSSPPPVRGATASGSSGDRFVPKETSSVASVQCPSGAGLNSTSTSRRKDSSVTTSSRRSPRGEEASARAAAAASAAATAATSAATATATTSSLAHSSVPPPPLQQQCPQPPRSPQRKRAQEERESQGEYSVDSWPFVPSAGTSSVPSLGGVAPPPGLEHLASPGAVDWNPFGAPPGLGLPDHDAGVRQKDETSDSFDEEVELLLCEKELVEAAAELGNTTSAEEDFFTTDADVDDEEEGQLPPPPLLPFAVARQQQRRSWQRPGVESVVIEEDDDEVCSDHEDSCSGFQADSCNVRSRLWAQSLLRMRRSIEEIYLLCEFESDENLCEQVRDILQTASSDFGSLLKQLETQKEYTLLGGDNPIKSGVAWTIRTPGASSKVAGSMLEQLEKAQLGSPSSGRAVGSKEKVQVQRKRPKSVESNSRRAWLDESQEVAEEDVAAAEDGQGEESSSRSSNLHSMVQSALERVHKRLGQGPQKLSQEEAQDRHEAKQRRAQARRIMKKGESMAPAKLAERRAMAAQERRRERESNKQCELLEKMTKARRQYQEHLRIVCNRARDENRKSAEVAFIARESSNSDREIIKLKLENASYSRKHMREKMQQKLIESAKRVAKVSEQRRKQLESWQVKVQQELEEKERLASQRRQEQLKSKQMKSQGQETRAEIVRVKRSELLKEDERSMQDFLRFRNKTAGRLAMDCDGLPEAVREEVVEQVPVASKSSKTSRKASSGRASTPPPTRNSISPKTSPMQAAGSAAGHHGPGGGAAAEISDSGEVEAVLPEVPKLPCSGGGGGGAASSIVFAAEPSEDAKQRALRRGSSSPSSVSGSVGCSKDRRVSSGAASSSAPGQDLSPAAASVPTTAVVAVESMLAADGATSQATSAAPATQQICAAAVVSEQPESESEFACSQKLRKQLETAAFGDDEALRIVCECEGSKAAAANAAHRAKISKLAIDLGKVTGLGPGSSSSTAGGATSSSDRGPTAATPMDDQQPASIINLERTEVVLGDFCKVLSQTQREADFALILKLGCPRIVVNLCLVVKDTIASLMAGGDKASSASWKQNCTVMLSALKFLGLLSKQRMARVFMLLTGRVVALSDVAIAYLDMQFADSSKPQDAAQGGPVLFLPQLLHLLTTHTKQALPEAAGCGSEAQGRLIAYLLLSGLAEKLRDLFRRAEIRGLKLFDGASSMPLLLLRAMCFLGTLLGAYRLPQPAPFPEASETHSHVLTLFQRSELFGIVSILVSILLSEGRREKGLKLPQTVVSLFVQAVRILNSTARIDLPVLQKTLGAGPKQQELYHLLVALLDYCSSRVPASVTKPNQSSASTGQTEENDLLHETVVLLGFYCLQEPENQTIMCYGEGQALVTRLTSLPLHYFMDKQGQAILFPTVLATCFRSQQNLELLMSEMNPSLLRSFLSSHLSQRNSSDSEVPRQEGPYPLAARFPPSLWEEALAFLDNPPALQEDDKYSSAEAPSAPAPQDSSSSQAAAGHDEGLRADGDAAKSDS